MVSYGKALQLIRRSSNGFLLMMAPDSTAQVSVDGIKRGGGPEETSPKAFDIRASKGWGEGESEEEAGRGEQSARVRGVLKATGRRDFQEAGGKDGLWQTWGTGSTKTKTEN